MRGQYGSLEECLDKAHQQALLDAARDSGFVENEERVRTLLKYAAKHGILAGFDNEHDAKVVAQALHDHGLQGQAANDWFLAQAEAFLADNDVSIVGSGLSICGGFGKPNYPSGIIMSRKIERPAAGGRFVFYTSEGLAICFGYCKNPAAKLFSTSKTGEGIAIVSQALLQATRQLN